MIFINSSIIILKHSTLKLSRNSNMSSTKFSEYDSAHDAPHSLMIEARKVAILIDDKWYQCRDYQEIMILEFAESIDTHKSHYNNLIKDGFNVPKHISKTFEPMPGVVFTIKYDIEELFKDTPSFKIYQFIFSKEDGTEYITTIYHTWDTPESLKKHNEVIAEYGEISDEFVEFLQKNRKH